MISSRFKSTVRFFGLIISWCVLLSCNAKYSEHKNAAKMVVLGGSLASREQGNATKACWQENLGVDIDTYAVGGAGFSNWRQNTILSQVERARNYKYYLLWCSTNDYGQPIEIDTDLYSGNSQNGGIRNAVRYIRETYHGAKIVALTSLPSNDGRDMNEYVEGQKKVFSDLDIPYLDQFNLFDEVDMDKYYMPDGQHLNVDGYEFIKDIQLEFLKINIL